MKPALLGLAFFLSFACAPASKDGGDINGTNSGTGSSSNGATSPGSDSSSTVGDDGSDGSADTTVGTNVPDTDGSDSTPASETGGATGGGTNNDGSLVCDGLEAWAADCCDSFPCGQDALTACGCCELPAPCDTVVLGEQGDGAWMLDPVTTIDAAHCALGVVAAGEPAQLRLEGFDFAGNMARNVWVIDAATVVVFHTSYADFSESHWTMQCAPASSKALTACQASDDPEVLGDCVRALFSDCTEEAMPICPAG